MLYKCDHCKNEAINFCNSVLATYTYQDVKYYGAYCGVCYDRATDENTFRLIPFEVWVIESILES